MDTVIAYLKHLGIPEAGAKVYCKLLEVGPKPVRELASLFNINRTTAYLYLDLLIEKGLVMKITKGSKVFIAPNKPDAALRQLVENQVQFAKSLQEKLPSITDTITTAYATFKDKDIEDAEIRYYKGKAGAKKIYEDALRAKNLCSFATLVETGGLFSENLTLFADAFKQNTALTVREILYDSPLIKEQAPQFLVKNKRYFYKIMPKNLQLSSEDILIYDGKVAIINYKKNIDSVMLQSPTYYTNSKELFDFIWQMIP